MFTTPILFLVFNRPDNTRKVFEQIRKIQPAYLYIAADGSRKDKPGEDKLCAEVRNILLSNIDWECEVKTLFRDENLGCGKAVSQAITWFFENVEEGIILEDDTVPDISFFKYCETLLNLYQNNERVMHISGCYFLKEYENIAPDFPNYFFTKHIHVWGWATWKRAWNYYDFSMKNFPIEKKYLRKYYRGYYKFWDEVYTKVHEKKIDTWDYQWMYSIFLKNGVAINPARNLIQNIGFNGDATHTRDVHSIYNSIPLETFTGFIHPRKVKIDKRRDELYSRDYLQIETKKNSLFKRGLSYLMKKVKAGNKKSNTEKIISSKELTRLKGMARYQAAETIFLGNKFSVVDAATFVSSYAEIFEQEIYKFRTNQSTPVIIDCGANIGLATIYFKLKYPEAKVLAFEPDPNIFTVLKNNVQSLDLKNVELFNEAIGVNKETLLFNMEGGHSGMLVVKPDKKTIPVPVTSLKEVLKKFDLIDFLKIDIEGYEINVLPAIAEELKKVNTLFLEYHTFLDQPQRLSEIIKIIEDAGFRYYVKESAYKIHPFLERELFYKMDMIVNIFCYRD